MKKDKKRLLVERFNKIDIYPVTCEKLSCGRTDIDILNAVIEGGAKIIQLRDKESSKKLLYKKAEKFRKITLDNNILLIINDHIDIAMAVNADGVHLGQYDFPLIAAKKLIPDKIIGVSTHSVKEAVTAKQDGADYINIGPIFPTATKGGLTDFLGVEIINKIKTRISMPFTVMGGITLDNIEEVLKKGANKIAAVTSITKTSNPAYAVKMFRKKILSY